LYDRKNNVIDARGVKFIRVADAAIFPNKEQVTIFRKAELDTLHHARLLTNLNTKYHKFKDVTASVQGRFRYEAFGDYDYTDMTEASQPIPFHRIYADRSAHTTGKAMWCQSVILH
jgi:hypothetical protein